MKEKMQELKENLIDILTKKSTIFFFISLLLWLFGGICISLSILTLGWFLFGIGVLPIIGAFATFNDDYEIY